MNTCFALGSGVGIFLDLREFVAQRGIHRLAGGDGHEHNFLHRAQEDCLPNLSNLDSLTP